MDGIVVHQADGEPKRPAGQTAPETRQAKPDKPKRRRKKPSEGELIDVPRRLASLARRIQTARRTVVTNLLAIGEHLAEAQALLADHNKGTFNKWVRERCDFTPRTAYHYLEVWRAFGGCEMASQRIDSDAIRKLATAPQEVIDEAKKRVGKGERITLPIAKQMVEAASPKNERHLPDPVHIEVAGGVVVLRPGSDGVSPEEMLRQAMAQLTIKHRAA